MTSGTSWSKRVSLVLALTLAWSGYALLWKAEAAAMDSGKCSQLAATPYLKIVTIPALPVPWPDHDASSDTHYYTSTTHNGYSWTHQESSDSHYSNSNDHWGNSHFHDLSSISWDEPAPGTP